jgi:hypothetical protein
MGLESKSDDNIITTTVGKIINWGRKKLALADAFWHCLLRN